MGHHGGLPRPAEAGSSSAPSTTIEELKDGRTQIVFTEIPYQLTKEPLLKKLADLVNNGRITGVSDVVDESDRKQPVRIVVKVKKGEDPNVVLNQLYQYSPLQDTFSVIMLALVDGRPKTLPLKEFLRLFVEHRVNVIRRRTRVPAPPGPAAGAHRRRACSIALHHIDEIIRVIRSSANPPEARVAVDGDGGLRPDPPARPERPRRQGQSASLTRMQADAILAMQLQQLTGLEADKLAEEYLGLRPTSTATRRSSPTSS